MQNKKWTAEEENYLEEKWGALSIPGIAKHLNRTVNAVKIRASRLGLGPVLLGGEYVTLNQLLIAVTGTNAAYSYKMKSWVENRGLPIHTRRVDKCEFRVVYLDEFWQWAEKNRCFLDFSKMEPLALGKEPEWVAEQRKKDFTSFRLQRKDQWTHAEEQELVRLLKQHRYGYAALSNILRRSEGAIQRKCMDLGLKERPVKADSHIPWTDADYQILADGIRCGDSYTVIGQAIGRSEKAVRGKVYYTYFTENADKVRELMGDGKYGTGAPIPTVGQALKHTGYRKETAEAISRLVALLRYRMNELGYEPYWQRFMCMKWDDIRGCTAGCENCDECTSFERIKPQYCVRCGGAFLERKTSRLCERCRIARKKQYGRMWYAMKKSKNM